MSPVTTHLNVFRWSIVNSNFDSEHRVLCPKNYLNLHENLLEIYLKLLVSNYWGGEGVWMFQKLPQCRPER
jgi:hypothetical protein